MSLSQCDHDEWKIFKENFLSELRALLGSHFAAKLKFKPSRYCCTHPAWLSFTVTYSNWTAIFEWCVVRCGSKNGDPKRHVFEKVWTTFLIIFTILGLNSQCNWGSYVTIKKERESYFNTE